MNTKEGGTPGFGSFGAESIKNSFWWKVILEQIGKGEIHN